MPSPGATFCATFRSDFQITTTLNEGLGVVGFVGTERSAHFAWQLASIPSAAARSAVPVLEEHA